MVVVSLALSSWHNTWCVQIDTISAEHKEGCDNFSALIVVLWIQTILVVAFLVTVSWGLCQINNFNAQGISTYWKILAAIECISVLMAIVGVANGARISDLINALVHAVFMAWFCYAL